jgi:DNA-binding CsgD family transcriptional regulator
MQEPSAILAAQRQLKRQSLDHWKDGDDFLRATCAEMILAIESPTNCWQVLASAMRIYIDCDRVDAGPCKRSDIAYSPIAQDDRQDVDVTSVLGLSLPNSNPSLQLLWEDKKPFISQNVATDFRLDKSLCRLLQTSGTRDFVSMAISFEGVDVGLICLDHIESSRQWNEEKAANVHSFIQMKAAPILSLAGQMDGSLDLLSPSEREVARLAAQAKSYKVIARTLGKSLSTVDHQLRSIRRKLGVKSHTELVRLLQVASFRDCV